MHQVIWKSIGIFYSKFEEYTAPQKFSMDEYRLMRVEQII